MNITGESVLVRKKFSEQFSVEANYFIDKVSGASVDVLSQASVIKDERKQKSLSLDYIHDKTQYNLSYTQSSERDYISNTTHFSLSQDMFGDLTTVTLGFTDSRDKIGVNGGRHQHAERRLAGARGEPQLPRRALADHHQKPDRRGSPWKSSPTRGC